VNGLGGVFAAVACASYGLAAGIAWHGLLRRDGLGRSGAVVAYSAMLVGSAALGLGRFGL
jgi:hypothetical protein